MKTSDRCLLASIAIAGTMSACATMLPAQLVEARYSYFGSSAGPVESLAPLELSDAKQALDRANKEFEQNGDTAACRDYSYIAENKLEVADAAARTELDRRMLGGMVEEAQPAAASSAPNVRPIQTTRTPNRRTQ